MIETTGKSKETSASEYTRDYETSNTLRRKQQHTQEPGTKVIPGYTESETVELRESNTETHKK